MSLAKVFVSFAVVVSLLGTSIGQSKADLMPMTPAGAAGGAAPAIGAVGWTAIGIIGVAGVLCLYDVWLKINHLKNWDGSPLVVQAHPHHNH